jgi:hypothetical protein
MSYMDERRRAPRVNLVGQLRGELVSVDTPIVVREISLGGMSIESETRFEVDARHEFMLTLGDGAGVLVLGRVAYCRTVEAPNGARFIIGIQFLDEETGDSGADVGGLIKRVH